MCVCACVWVLVGAECTAWAGSAQCAPLVVLAGRSLRERLALVGAECTPWACVCVFLSACVLSCRAEEPAKARRILSCLRLAKEPRWRGHFKRLHVWFSQVCV